MKTTELTQKQNWFNPMYLESKEINHIVFFDNETGETILEPTNENIRWFGNSNNDYPMVSFPFEIKRKNSIDLKSKSAFYTSFNYKYSMDKGKIVIYIPIQLLENFKCEKNVFQYETETDKKYFDVFSFDTIAIKKVGSLDENEKLIYSNGEPTKHTLTFHGYYKEVLKKLGRKVEATESIFKEYGINISTYDLAKLLKKYELTPIK